jgi:capsular exopolysaccharide synthesis family protein
VRPLDRAAIPGAPFVPDIRQIVRTSAVVGLLVFLVVSIGLSFVDDRIKSSWDVESFIGVNLVGIVPDLSGMSETDKYTLVQKNSEIPGVESFLGIYSSVKIQSKIDFPKAVLVTSTIPGEGKTLVSCNFAGSFARHGKSTLLVDCDLRRPTLHRHFPQNNEAGIIAWFENGAALDGDLVTNPRLGITKIGENLSLLCSGGRSKSPTEIMEDKRFAQLIERLKKSYDLVVLDSPPMGAVSDALLLAERADEVLYVCRFNRALRKHIRLYIQALQHGKNEILGIVLNGMSTRRIEYYSNYRYYRSYKKYYGTQA